MSNPLHNVFVDEGVILELVELTAPYRPIESTELRCLRCGDVYRYPLIARRQDIEHMRKLLECAEKYLKEQGGYEAMILAILEGCAEGFKCQRNQAVEVKDEQAETPS